MQFDIKDFLVNENTFFLVSPEEFLLKPSERKYGNIVDSSIEGNQQSTNCLVSEELAQQEAFQKWHVCWELCGKSLMQLALESGIKREFVPFPKR